MTDATTCWSWDDAGIDVVIERRHARFTGPDSDDAEHDPSWRESVAKFNEAAQAERRGAWIAHHLDLARLHSQLAREYEEKADQLANPKPVVQTESVTSNVTGNGGGEGRA